MSDLFYSHDEIRKLMATIHAANLEGTFSFWNAPLEAIRASSNGIGPDRWPEDIRKVVTCFLDTFAEAAVVHDWEFSSSENDGTLERWHEANARFEVNCRKLIRHKISAWRFLRRLQAQGVVNLLMDALESHKGRQAWEEAFQRLQAEQEAQAPATPRKNTWRSR